MKKLIGTVAVAALLASAAFAEISLGAWLRAIAAPAAGDGDSIYSGMTNSWGWGTRVARVDINGSSEDGKIGFSMGVYNDVDGIQPGDNKVIWAKPWDWLKISLGRWDYTTFRGDLCYGSWNWIRPENWLFADEGLTFDQLGAGSGMQLEITPVDGLVLMWQLPMSGWIDSWSESYKMFEQSEAAVKYTIGSVGTIKAGWGGKGARKYRNKGHDAGYGVVVGDKAYYYASKKDAYEAKGALEDKWLTNPESDDAKLYNALDSWKWFNKDNYFDAVDPSGELKYWGDVNVAFDLTAVENLYVTVGAKISLAESDYKKECMEGADPEGFKFIKVALGASYQILDNLKVAASFGVQTYEEWDPSFQFGVGVDFGIVDALTLNVDFRGLFMGDQGEKTYDPQFSFLVGLQYAMSSNGYVGIGFQGTTGGTGFLGNLQQDNKFAWAVPIAVSCWF